MISSYEEIDSLFKEIDKILKIKIDAYVIGGAALLYKGIKPATKDIDIVVSSGEEFEIFQKTLVNLGFATKKKTAEYTKMNIDNIFERDDFRIDLFLNTICAKFVFSEKMKKRSELVKDYGKLKINLSSEEDILLLKSITGDRAGDREDCIELAKTGPEWDLILDEINDQISLSGNDVWITWIEERFNEMQNEGIIVPILDKIKNQSHKYYERYENL